MFVEITGTLQAMASKAARPKLSELDGIKKRSDTGGLPELNVNGETGFLSDIGDVDEMAKNAIYILEDNDRLEKFKDAALERAKTFQLSNIMPQYEEYYRQVIEKVKNS